MISPFGPSLTDHNVTRLRTAHMNRACDAVGLNDFGPDDFVTPLEVMLDDLVHHARLSRFGHLITPYYLQQILRERLRVQAAISSRGETDSKTNNEASKSPVFILGLPRTGSTLLHELLDLHPTLRAPTFWESHHLPQNSARNIRTKALTYAQVEVVDWLAPTFRRIHKLRAMGPHECVSIQACTFRSMQFHAAFRLPTYDAWMRDEFDWEPAYTWHRRHLDVLSEVKSRWLLKAPAHMLGIDALVTAYPNARFVQLHRNPSEVIPSMASLSLSLRAMASKRHDPHELGHDVAGLWHKGLMAVMAARAKDAALNTRFLDIPYRSFITDPLAKLETISNFIDIPFTIGYTNTVQSYLDKHRQHRHGVHKYDLAQFGLTTQTINDMYRPYLQNYLADVSST